MANTVDNAYALVDFYPDQDYPDRGIVTHSEPNEIEMSSAAIVAEATVDRSITAVNVSQVRTQEQALGPSPSQPLLKKRATFLGMHQLSASLDRIAIAKRRSCCATYCELCSHFCMVLIIVYAHYIATAASYSAHIYSKYDIVFPPNQGGNDDTASAVGGTLLKFTLEVLQGPLLVPSIDQYVYLGGRANESGIGEQTRSVRDSIIGRSLQNLIHLGDLHFVPDTNLTWNLIDYLYATNEKFGKFHVVVHDTESHAMKYMKSHPSQQVFGMIVLNEISASVVDYTIRQDFMAIPSTSYMLSDTAGYDFNFDFYFVSGFMTLQQAVDGWVFNVTGAMTSNVSSVCADGAPKAVMIPFPTHPYETNDFYDSFQLFVGMCLVMATLYPVSKLTKSLVEEKENKIRELMKIMGLHDWVYLTSWFLIAFLIFLWIALTIALISFRSFFHFSSFGLLFLFFLLFCVSEIAMAFLISVIFNNSKLASIVAPVVLFATVLPGVALDLDTISASKAFAMSLLSPTSLVYGVSIIMKYEKLNQGVQSFNMNAGDYAFSSSLIMLIVDIGLYGLLGMYLDQVLPRENGTPRHPLFFLSANFWFGNCSFFTMFRKRQLLSSDEQFDEMPEFFDDPAENPNIEPIDKDLRANAFVRIKGLWKRYDDGKVAVRDFSLTLLEGQITCLLGHNGAGKSTTIASITGMTEATKGGADIYGFSLEHNLDQIRCITGLCPQQNVLFPNLTVLEHLMFFGALKGLMGRDLRESAEAAMMEVGLTEKRHVRSMALSGGMKRKLGLAMALAGDPKFVLLDEPTSGMDPHSRRATWELLQRSKKGRVVLLTTHFMDEADTLADRVAIMSAGRIRCSGSSLFLKNRFGAGYLLSLARVKPQRAQITTEAHNPDNHEHHESDDVMKKGQSQIENEIKSVIPAAEVKSSIAGELIFQLPLESSIKFPDLFEMIRGKAAMLGIGSYGVSLTTLEQVFITLAHTQEYNRTDDLKEDLPQTMSTFWDDVKAYLRRKMLKPCVHPEPVSVPEATEEQREQRSKTFYSSMMSGDGVTTASMGVQIVELYRKRWIASSKDMKGIFFQVIFPAIQVLAILALLTVGKRHPGPEIIMNGNMLTTYANLHTSVPYAEGPTNISTASTFNTSTTQSIVDVLNRTSSEIIFGFTNSTDTASLLFTENMANQTFSLENVTAVAPWVRNSTELSYYLLKKQNYIPNRFGAYVYNDQIPMNIQVDWFAVNGDYSDDKSDDGDDDLLAELSDLGTVSYVGKGHNKYTVMHNTTCPHAVVAYRSELIAAAYKTCSLSATKPQYIVRNHPLPTSTSDSLDRLMLSVIVALFLMIPLGYFPAGFVTFVVKERTSKSKHLQIVSGVSPVLYWLVTYLWDLTLYLLLFGLIMIGFAIIGTESAAAFIGDAEVAGVLICLLLSYGAAILSASYFYSLFQEDHASAQISIMTLNFATGFMMVVFGYILQTSSGKQDYVVVIISYIFRCFPPYAFGEGLITLAGLYFKTAIRGKTVKYFDWDQLGVNIGMLCGEAVFYFLIVLLSEVPHFHYLATKLNSLRYCGAFTNPPPRKREVDSDVAEEEELVSEEIRRTPTRNNDEENSHTEYALLIDKLLKTYPAVDQAQPKYAIRGVSLACPTGERFGLLGINGAGKSTTMGVLTKEIFPTAGHVMIGGKSILDPATQRMLGYCPQVDPLMESMNSYETLWFYGRIRGIAADVLQERIECLVEETGLKPHAHRPCGTYSGGNKRKLSLAVALIGNPKVLLLDEPSTGMDPEARRHMWNVIEKVSANRTVVLVSHSMEEVEALCTRVGVMVSGRLQCLGAIQHLKGKFGGGYEVEVRCSVTQADACLSMCMSGLKPMDGSHASSDGQFIELQEMHGGSFKLQVKGALDLAGAFRLLEEHKAQYQIYDYNISQCTLEQIFIKFARDQDEETQHNK